MDIGPIIHEIIRQGGWAAMVAFLWVYSMKSNRDLIDRVTIALNKADENFRMMLTWGQERGKLEARLTDLLDLHGQHLQVMQQQLKGIDARLGEARTVLDQVAEKAVTQIKDICEYPRAPRR